MASASTEIERYIAMRGEERRIGVLVCARLDSNATTATSAYVLASRTGVGILAEGVWVAFRKNLHQPPIEVIKRGVQAGFEASIVLSMGFLIAILSSDGEILFFPA